MRPHREWLPASACAAEPFYVLACAHASLSVADSQPACAMCIECYRTGEIDLYAWLMLGGSMSCLLNSQWWHPIALAALFVWYLRYAGLRVFTPEAQLCSTPAMHIVAGVQCVGPYKKSRKVMADKQAVMARYHLELPHFRLFLDDPVATPPDQCRCIVGVVVEGKEEQQKFRDRASNTRDLLESEIYGQELKGDSLLVSADLDREQKAREAALAKEKAQQKKSEALTPAERRKRRRAAAEESARFSDPGEHRAWSRVRVPPIINFKFLEGSAKSFLSAWLVPRAAARAFSKLALAQNQSTGSGDAAILRWPRIELEDRWW
eukprot:COSAG02_NODE_5538_length_4245_cov_120.115533_6_plen_321_part_00